MTYTIKINVEGFQDPFIFKDFNTTIFNLTYSSFLKPNEGGLETNNSLNIGTVDGTIRLTDCWNTLRRLELANIKTVEFIDQDTETSVYTFEDQITNIIYNINLNGPGDMIIFNFRGE